MAEEHIYNVTAVSLQTREHNFGVILFPHAERRMFGSSNLRLLIGLALQIGLTLENYVVMHDAQRRTKEYALLTQIGQAISSRLDQDEILRTVQKELGQIFDTSDFYIAFQEGDEIRFELEVEKGEVLPKRSRKPANGLTRVHHSHRAAAADPLRTGEDARAAGRHLHAAAAGQMLLRRAHPAGRQAGRSHGGDEHGARVRFRATRSGSDADRGRPGFGGGGERPAVCRGAAALAPAGVPEQYFQDRDFQRRFRADAGGHRRPDPEEFQLRPHRHRHSRLRRPKKSRSRPRPASPPRRWASASRWEWEFSAGWRGPAKRAGADHERSAPAGRAAGVALRAVHPDHLRRELARRAQRGEPERRCLQAGGPADHEYAGRPAGHRAAQCLRFPEAAAAVHHRRADRHQDAALFLGSAQFGVETRLPLRASHSRWC